MDSLLESFKACDAGAYIPHQGRMRLIDSITSLDPTERAGTVSSCLREDAPYFQGKEFQQHWLIEIMAQAAAAISQILKSKPQDGVPRGYLIAIKEFKIVAEAPLAAGSTLSSRIRFDVDLSPIGHCESSIFTSDGRLLAQSEMTFLSDETGLS